MAEPKLACKHSILRHRDSLEDARHHSHLSHVTFEGKSFIENMKPHVKPHLTLPEVHLERASLVGSSSPSFSIMKHSVLDTRPFSTNISARHVSFSGPTTPDEEEEAFDGDPGFNFNQIHSEGRRSSDPFSISEIPIPKSRSSDNVSRITHHGSVGSFGNDSIGGGGDYADAAIGGGGGGGGGLGVDLNAFDKISMRSALKKQPLLPVDQIKSTSKVVSFQGEI